jgi:hypothetical protein
MAGCDDLIAICSQCDGLMLRLDEDIFQPYSEKGFDLAVGPSVGQDFKFIFFDSSKRKEPT